MSSGVHHTSSNDGRFCNECLSKPEVNFGALLEGFVVVKNLKSEYEDFMASFIKRKEAAEERVVNLVSRTKNQTKPNP